MAEQRHYTISELAEEFGVTTRTIRFYEEKGWLAPMRVGQRRVFRSKDRTRLRLILRGKRIGLTLEESVDIIGLYDAQTGSRRQLEVLLERIGERRAALSQQLADLKATLRALNETEQRARDALTSGSKRAARPRSTK
ncbi:MAG: MerR family DNA-binding transcriptional regulator [Pseudomonadota bacterium]